MSWDLVSMLAAAMFFAGLIVVLINVLVDPPD